MPKQNKLILLGAILLAAGLSAFAAAPAQGPVLPDRFGVWQASGPAQLLKALELPGPQGPGGAVLQEAGIGKIEERLYQNGEGSITLRAYQFRDSSGAFEFYTYLLRPGAHDLGFGENSAGSGSSLRFLVGNVVVESSVAPGITPDTLRDAFAALQAKVDRTPLPPLRTYFPLHSRLYGSEKYAFGPEAFQSALASLDQAALLDLTRELGFQDGAEAMLARFESGHEKGILLLIEYPTPQLAEQHLHHLEGALPNVAKEAGVRFERKASLLSAVLAPSTPEFAKQLRADVNYETQVTWNEGSHVATEPPMVVMIVKIFAYTGMFLAVATGLGLAFGVMRVFIKRYFPGKVFDRTQDIEVLQMGLSGKKIDSSDMY